MNRDLIKELKTKAEKLPELEKAINELKDVAQELIDIINDEIRGVDKIYEIIPRITIGRQFFETIAYNNINIHIPTKPLFLWLNIKQIEKIKETIKSLPESPEKEFLEFLISLHPKH